MTKKFQNADPFLYILMRTDLVSMNAGKGMAQACHAANAFVAKERSGRLKDLVKKWENSTEQNFGTTIVLDGGSISNIKEIVGALKCDDDISVGICHDPSYPIRDGEIVHLLPIDTCAWVFGDRNNTYLRGVLDLLDLHP